MVKIRDHHEFGKSERISQFSPLERPACIVRKPCKKKRRKTHNSHLFILGGDSYSMIRGIDLGTPKSRCNSIAPN